MTPTDLITVDPEIRGGAPVFKETRVPVRTLFEYLASNYSLDEFLECFPSVSRELALRVLERSESALLTACRYCWMGVCAWPMHGLVSWCLP